MKKIYIILSTIILTFASCNMDLEPQGVIRDDEALVTIADYESFTNGLYTMMRSVTSGDFVVLSDIQLDDFHAVIGNGNRRMQFYNGVITPTIGEIASIYAGYYSVIAQTNFFIERADEKIKASSLSPANLARMKNYSGVAHFIRAYCYNALADKFCGSYKNAADIDAPDAGLSLQLTYSPTADNKTYPARSSMKATYAQILDDLAAALSGISYAEQYEKTNPTSNSNYITSDAVKALLARVNLNMGNDDLAYNYAKEVIDTQRYPLTNSSNFATLWNKDTGSEVIWQVQAEFAHHGSATGVAFMSAMTNADYVPTKDCILLFDENDIRWMTWFDENNVENSGGKASMFYFSKYPGNSELYASGASSNYVNKAKPFRSAELYLIAAEACCNLNKDTEANSYLKTIEDARYAGYPGMLTGTALLAEIQNERHRELIGEGFRLSDLKRWNLGFTRSEAWEGGDGVIVANNKNLHYDSDDYRLVWPIPQHEMDANPQVKQNPGY